MGAIALVALVSFTALPSGPHPARTQSPELIRIEGLGALRFINTGSPDAQPAFARGVLALHSFWYVEARRAFREARAIDPGFALAYWGEAMTYDHPVWGEQDTRSGRKVLERLDSLTDRQRERWTARERLYLDAARHLFGDGSLQQRRRRAERALARIRDHDPGDDEALAFHALLVVANHSARGRGRAKVLSSAADLEALLERNPEHPAAHHYLIHAFDHPELARRATGVAERYPRIAWKAPHAVHMPAHVYRQLGQWERVAEACRAAYEVSVRWVEREGLSNTHRDFHSLRWLHTAYLRLGEPDEARALHEHVDRVHARGGDRQRLDRIRAAMEREYARSQR